MIRPTPIPPQTMRPRRPGGFTLIEMLAVIAVIFILMALLLPAAGRLRRAGQRVQCANRLREVYNAYVQRRQDEEGSRRWPRMTGEGWNNLLLPYASFERSIFLCPADGGRETRPYGQWWAQMPVFSPQNAKEWVVAIPSQLNHLAQQHSATYRFTPCMYAVRRNSENDFSFHWCNASGNQGGCNYLFNEDGISSIRYSIRAIATNVVDHTFTLEVYDSWNVDGNPWHTIYFQIGDGRSLWAQGEGFDEGVLIGGRISSIKGVVHPTFEYPVTRSSFAMNLDANDPRRAAERTILLTDSHWGLNTDARTPPSSGNFNNAARHDGRMNVLFADGSMESVDPDTITPQVTAHRPRFWFRDP